MNQKYYINRENTHPQKFTPEVVDKMVKLIRLSKAIRSEAESYENISK